MREKKEHPVDAAVAARIAAVRRVSSRSRPRWLTTCIALLAVAVIVLLTWCGAARDENGAVELRAWPAPVEAAPTGR
jgi:hypothetical protein